MGGEDLSDDMGGRWTGSSDGYGGDPQGGRVPDIPGGGEPSDVVSNAHTITIVAVTNPVPITRA